VTIDPAERDVRVVLLDIEGTTTPMTFVHDVLFPFARSHLAGWCRSTAGSDVYRRVFECLAADHEADRRAGEPAPPWRTETRADADRSLQAYVLWLMELDRKSTGLKLLQGLIWEQGYRSGALRGDVYPDVPLALRRWRQAGVGAAIFSSGSELAQRRLFGSTSHGDLTPLIADFFDTRVGSKHSSSSYVEVASRLGVPAPAMLFVSDVTSELEAAARAGCGTLLSVRPGNRHQPNQDRYSVIRTFDEILP
jgi:enolase-phosphatase E1